MYLKRGEGSTPYMQTWRGWDNIVIGTKRSGAIPLEMRRGDKCQKYGDVVVYIPSHRGRVRSYAFR